MTEDQASQPFIAHLLELRDRLLRMILGILVLLLVLFPFANEIYHFIATPLLAHLPEGTQMIATQVASPFLTPFKLSLVAAVFLTIPWILYQFWAFVAPGLYQHEKRLVMPLLASSTILFYLGMAFAYYLVFPLVFKFLVGVTPEGVAMMTDIAAYLDFVLTLFFAFGIAFEVPIATFLLVWTGVTNAESLAKKRPYVIVVAFVVGMFLTPPDVISQTLLAIPMWLLFEAGIIFSRLFIPGKGDEDEGPKPPPARVPVTAGAAASAEGGTDRDAEPPRYVPLTEEEMEAELDAIEASEGDDEGADDDEDATPSPSADALEDNLKHAHELRMKGEDALARDLLYEVLRFGDDKQVEVARNILQQMDE
ncbi:MAG: twin-arginine translocase subunit TatC [Gammaproteobacteria bacterium SHHR-1]|uniref:twin-arginine translocase subunit TatC n=1 Tax=Magnetovirga frankeli TaxID=947516 RepID=UPI001292FF66|nr:twin-arginine translocase subunit TatC [gamma proteobacterium SS-5]